MLRRVSSTLSLILLLLAVSASAQMAQFLAIEGEGTASVILDKASRPSEVRTAYITDGGKGGRLGLGGARIRGKEVLQYLLDEGVTRLVITCSHPHSDHMDGLKKAVRDPKIKGFNEIVFIDNGYDNPESLLTYYRKRWGNNGQPKVSYSSAAKRDAFAGLAKPNSAVRVSNFDYDPEGIPGSSGEAPIHGRSIITQYEIVDHERTIRVVDLDDASSPLIAKWSGQKPPPRLNVLISAHHGSIKNDISPILDQRVKLGLRDVIITANLENHHDHPSPELLLKLLRDLGPDHVFITGSQAGENIEITAEGVQVAESKTRHRERLASLIESRIDHHMGLSRDLIQRAHARAGESVVAKAAIGSQPSERRFEALGSQKLLSSKELSRLMRSTKTLEHLEAALALVRRSPNQKSPLATLLLGFDPFSLGPKPNGWKPDPYEEGIERYYQTQLRLQQDGKEDMSIVSPAPGLSGSGSSAAKLDRKTRFDQERTRPWPTWGGIILGNTVSYSGLKPVELQILVQEQEEATALLLKVTFADGTSAALADITPTELWAAYNFVQPTPALETLYGEFGKVQANATGLVGCTDQGEGCKCKIHPAIANTYLARDAMRLDMTFFATRKLKVQPFGVGIIDQKNLDFSAYQWYDTPAQVQVWAGRIKIEPSTEPKNCFLRVKFFRRIYPDWYDSSQPQASIQTEFESRVDSRLSSLEKIRSMLKKNNPSQEQELLSSQFDNLVASRRRLIKTIEAQVKGELQQELKSSSSRSDELPSSRLEPLCHSFDAFQTMDRLARLVAVLNWYTDLSGRSLPALPHTLKPVSEKVPASWPYSSVFIKRLSN
jgi:hypothetical protein